MAYVIRPFSSGDASELASLTLAAIRGVGAISYTPEQVAAWSARHPGPDRFLERVNSGASIFVAADSSDTAMAYALIEPDGHLDMLYCHPDHTRRGLADELLAASEQHARAEGITRLYTEASELARPAFERAGYAVQHRRDFEIPHEGEAVAIHNFAMEKPLN
ncbi:GNAT family N-acetyltransferase [Erythrobacter sp. F6033]|uniref:GNAT family N-acetyltransferase n=1 Tax=Erythrobacter sp. F6033 TaxID=2926401 RepID=UPI001FF65F89|nr:GNAT family N-acetyltransferase [Erythrobacter sp. F6033]MCK0128459.1 GNAT family N-acetyltransferase [Erythrobacter sp. F6033]